MTRPQAAMMTMCRDLLVRAVGLAASIAVAIIVLVAMFTSGCSGLYIPDDGTSAVTSQSAAPSSAGPATVSAAQNNR